MCVVSAPLLTCIICSTLCFETGGPLFSSTGSLVGIVSFGTGECAERGETGAYSRVSDYEQFIRNGICNLSSSPPANCGGRNKDGKESGGNTGSSGNIWGEGSGCFSAANTVEVRGKGHISMDSLRIGDYIRAGNGQFSQVYSFGHLDRDAEAEFLQIYYTDSLLEERTIEVTLAHMLFVSGKTVRASQVKVGDMLDETSAKVTEIKTVKRRGVYAPVTMSGDLVVSGALASSYVALLDHATIDQHAAAHAIFTPLRLICSFKFDICKNETYTDGISNWVVSILPFVGKLNEQCTVQVTASLLAVPVVVAAYCVEHIILLSPFFLIVGALALGVVFFSNAKKKLKMR